MTNSRSPSKSSPLYAVIMAGGKGRRFWPKSRASKPKQLLPIGAPEPLVRETVTRLLPILPPTQIFIACGQDLAPQLAAILPEIPAPNFIAEPVGRDTAAGVGLALHQLRHGPARAPADAVIAVLPADHAISRPAKFRRTLQKAAAAARAQRLIITIGITPDRPSPAYGYIRPGDEIPGQNGVRRVRRFAEKPKPAIAKRYIKSGYLWNAGMFIFRLDVMLDAFAQHLPAMAHDLARIGDAFRAGRPERTVARLFPRLQKISLDYGIMEKAANVAVIAGDFQWTDVGGWDALYCLLAERPGANVAAGEVELVDSQRCYAEGGRLIALVGVHDLVVVDTGDAVLVMDRRREGLLKELTDRLAQKGRHDLL